MRLCGRGRGASFLPTESGTFGDHYSSSPPPRIQQESRTRQWPGLYSSRRSRRYTFHISTIIPRPANQEEQERISRVLDFSRAAVH